MLCNAERGYVYLKAKSSRSLECKPILSRASYNIPFGDEGGIAGKAASEMQAIVANAATGFISPNDPTLRMSASRNIDDPLDWIAVPIVTIDKSWGSSRKYVSGVLVCRFRSGCKAEPHNVEACKQFAGFIANLYLRQNLVLGDEGSRKNSSAASKSPGDYDDDAERSHTVQSLLQKIERWKLRMAEAISSRESRARAARRLFLLWEGWNRHAILRSFCRLASGGSRPRGAVAAAESNDRLGSASIAHFKHRLDQQKREHTAEKQRLQAELEAARNAVEDEAHRLDQQKQEHVAEKQRLQAELEAARYAAEDEAHRLDQQKQEHVAEKQRLQAELEAARNAAQDEIMMLRTQITELHHTLKVERNSVATRQLQLVQRVRANLCFRSQSRSYRQWVNHTQIQKRMRFVGKKALVHIIQRGLCRAFERWRVSMERRRRTRKLMLRMMRRLQNMYQHKAWGTWRCVHGQGKEREFQLLRRVRSNLCYRTQTRGFRRWAAQTALRKRMKFVGTKALLHIVKRGICRAFETWRAHAEQRQRVRSLSLRMLRRLRSVQLNAGLHKWRRVVLSFHMQRERRLLDRVRNNMLHRLKSRAFRGWSHKVQTRRRLMGIGKSVIVRLTRQGLVRCFGKWRHVVDDRLRARELLGRILGRMCHLGILRGWTTWRYVSVQRKERQLQLLRRVRANLCFRSCSRCFRQWHQHVQIQKRMRYVGKRALSHFIKHGMSRAFESWVNHIQIQKRMRFVGKKALVHIIQRGLCRAFERWRVSMERRRRTRKLMLRMMRRLQNMYQHKAWGTWRCVHGQGKEREFQLLRRVRSNLCYRTQTRGFRRWAAQTALRKRMKFVGTKALLHIVKRGICRAFETWRAHAEQRQRVRSLSLRMLRRLRSVQLNAGLHKWRRVVLSFHMQRERRLLDRVRNNMLHRLKSRAFRGWSHKVQTRRRLMGIGKSVIVRLTRQGLVRCFGKWRHVVDDRLRARELLGRILGRMCHLGILRGWTTWRYVSVQRKERQLQLLRRVRANLCFRSCSRCFRQWHQHVQIQKRMRYVGKRALSHFIKHGMSRAFESWVNHIQIQKRMRFVGKKALVHIIQRGLCRAFERWRVSMERRRRTRKLMLRMMRRLQNMYQHKAWGTWRCVHGQGKEREFQLLRRVRSNLCYRTQTRGFRRWAAQTALRKRMKFVGTKALLHIVKRGICRAFETWRAHAEQRQRVRSLSLRMLRRLRSVQLNAGLHKWRRVVLSFHMQRERRLLDRVRNNMLHRLKSRAFRGWSHKVQTRRRLMGIGKSVIVRLTRQGLVRCFGKWRHVVDDRLRARELLGRILGRMCHLGILRGWTTWRYVSVQRKERQLQLLRRVRANLCFRSCSRCFRQWHQHVQIQKRMRYVGKRALSHFIKQGMSRAFQSWALFVEQRIRMRGLFAVVFGKKLTVLLKLGWDHWRRAIVRINRAHVVKVIGLRHFVYKNVGKAFNTWKDYRWQNQRRKSTLARARTLFLRRCARVAHQHLRYAWRSWTRQTFFVPAKRDSEMFGTVLKLTRASMIMRLTRRFLHKHRWRALNKWKYMTVRKTQAMRKASRVLSRWFAGIVGPAFVRWRRHSAQLTQILRAFRLSERCCLRLNRVNLRTAWTAWIDNAILLPTKRESNMYRGTVLTARSSFVSRLTERFLFHEVERAWDLWKRITVRMRLATVTSCEVISGWYCRQVGPAFRRWQERSRVLTRMYSIMGCLLNNLAANRTREAFVVWLGRIRAHRNQCTAMIRMEISANRWRRKQLFRGINTLRFAVTWTKTQRFKLVALSQKRRVRDMCLRRRIHVWRSRVIQRHRARKIIAIMMARLRRATLSTGFSAWMACHRILQIQRDKEKIRMHKALCRWRSTAELMVIDQRYDTEVDIYRQRIGLMLNRFRTIKIPEYLANTNKIRGRTLSELRKVLAKLQNLRLREDAMSSRTWEYVPGGTAYSKSSRKWDRGKESADAERKYTLKESTTTTVGSFALGDLVSESSSFHETASEFREKLLSLSPSPSIFLDSPMNSRRNSRTPSPSASLINAGFSPGEKTTTSLLDGELRKIDSSLDEINTREWTTRYGHGTSLLTTPERTKTHRPLRPIPGGGGSGIRRSQSRLPPPTERYDTEERMVKEISDSPSKKTAREYLPSFFSDL